jgi:hypothetical protein
MGSFGVDGKNGEGSFKLVTVRRKAFRQVMFLEVVSGGRIDVVELMIDRLPLRTSGSSLAFSGGD